MWHPFYPHCICLGLPLWLLGSLDAFNGISSLSITKRKKRMEKILSLVLSFLNLMEQESFIIKKVLVSLTPTEVNFFA